MRHDKHDEREAREVHCCLRCGRDTQAKDQICNECAGRFHKTRRPRKLRSYRDAGIHEDDYSEESFPPTAEQAGDDWNKTVY